MYRRLVDAGIETFLPLQKRMKQWSDRKKLVEEPLLRSYIFVRITEKDYFRVLGTPGVVRYVSFEGKAAPIPDRQIDTLKMLIGEQVNIEVLEHDISPGEKVEIELGTMRGFEGELVRIAGENRVVIRIEHVTHSLLVTLPSHYIVKKR